jgi:hypothetical protein
VLAGHSDLQIVIFCKRIPAGPYASLVNSDHLEKDAAGLAPYLLEQTIDWWTTLAFLSVRSETSTWDEEICASAQEYTGPLDESHPV